MKKYNFLNLKHKYRKLIKLFSPCYLIVIVMVCLVFLFVANVKLVPPSAPDVYQLSDTSVKLNWTVPANDGLNIIFFRVQYRVIKPKKSPWQTDDNEIQGDRRQYEVKNLVAEGTFKFRIAAVYSNNDNKAGPNSDKFTLHLPTYQQPQVPKNPPTIVEVKPITYMDNYALNIKWNVSLASFLIN